LLDDMYEPDRPDDHKRLGGPKDMNGLGGLEKSDVSIRPNDSKNSDEPEDPNGPGGLEDPNGSNESKDPNGSA